MPRLESRTIATVSPLRSPAPVERLMVLDTVLAEPRLRWLGSGAREGRVLQDGNDSQVEGAAPSGFRTRDADKTIRHFPDKLPIGVAADGRTHVFLYLVNRPTPVDFRAFLHRHAELLRALPEWELRLLVPRHLVKAAPLYEDAAARGVEPAACAWTTPPSFAGTSGSRTRSIEEAPRRFQALPACVSSVQGAAVSRALSALEEERRPARECHGLAGTRGQDRAAQRPRDQRGAAPCLCPSHTPGWLRVARGSPRTEGGTQTREERSPSWCAQRSRRSARRRHVAVGACVPHVVESERVA